MTNDELLHATARELAGEGFDEWFSMLESSRVFWRKIASKALRIAAFNAAQAHAAALFGQAAPELALPPDGWGGTPCPEGGDADVPVAVAPDPPVAVGGRASS